MRPAAMHNHRIDTGLFQQHNIMGKQLGQCGIAHRMTAIFNDHCLAVIALHEGQCLGQHMRLFQPCFRAAAPCSVFCAAFACARFFGAGDLPLGFLPAIYLTCLRVVQLCLIPQSGQINQTCNRRAQSIHAFAFFR